MAGLRKRIKDLNTGPSLTGAEYGVIDNGTNVYKATGHEFAKGALNIINARAYASLQAAIDAIPAGGGTLLIDSDFTITSALTFTKSNAKVQCRGKITAGALFPTSGTVLTITGSNIVFDNLEIDGGGIALRGVTVLTGSDHVTFNRPRLTNFASTAADSTVPYALGIRDGTSNVFVNLPFISGVNAGHVNGIARGIHVTNLNGTGAPSYIQISGGFIGNITPITDGDGIVFQNDWNANLYSDVNGVSFEGCAKRAVKIMERGVSVRGCQINGAGYAGISVYASDCNVVGNTIKNAYGDAVIEIGGASILLSHINVTGNTIQKASDAEVGTTGDGISILGSLAHSHITISGNTIEHVRKGIRIGAPVSRVSVCGNTVKNTTQEGVFVDGAVSYVSVCNNIFESVSSYGVRFSAGSNVEAFGNQGGSSFEIVLVAASVLSTYSGWGNSGPSAGLGNIIRDGIAFPISATAKTGNYTVADSDYCVTVDCTGAARTMTLPPVTGRAGRILVFKKIDASANAMILDGTGAETIDGAATLSKTTQWDAVRIICDGSKWFVI